MALFASQAGVQLTHVPYKGAGPAVQDLLGGQVDLFITTPASVVQHIKADKLKGLAVTSNARLTSLPQVPTTREVDLKDFMKLSFSSEEVRMVSSLSILLSCS